MKKKKKYIKKTSKIHAYIPQFTKKKKIIFFQSPKNFQLL